MDLLAFEAMVRSIVNRGTKFDAEITTQTRFAAKWLERNYSLKSMERLQDVSVDGADTALSLGASRVKNIEWFRFLLVGDEQGNFHYLEKGDPKDFSVFESARPKYYWFEEGTSRIVLSTKSDVDYSGEIFFNQFTDWPTDTSETNWWLEEAEDVLLARVLWQLSPIVRRPDLMSYKEATFEGVRTLILSDEEERFADHSPAMKVYTG